MPTADDSRASPDEAVTVTASERGRASGDPNEGLAIAAEFAPPRMTLALKGELDLADAPSLEREILALPWSHLTELIVDLAEVTFVDSTGLHVLIRASQRAAAAGVRFSVVHVPEQPRKLFTLVGLTDSLNVQP